MAGVKNKRAQGHAKRKRTCVCGRVLHGNGHVNHYRRCEAFKAHHVERGSIGVLIRCGVPGAW